MTSIVLVLNAGSSSLKYSLVDAETGESDGRWPGRADRYRPRGGSRIGHRPAATPHRWRSPITRPPCRQLSTPSPSTARRCRRPASGRSAIASSTVARRSPRPPLVDDDLLEGVRDLIPLAPLHNAANLEGLQVARRMFPDVPQVAVFDTAFHQTLEPHAYTYAVPLSWRDDHGVRRYGFHGTSCAYVSREAARMLGRPSRRRQPHRAAPGQRRFGDGRQGRALGGDVHGPDAAGGPGHGVPLGRPGPSRARPSAASARAGRPSDIDHALNQESGLQGLAGDNDLRAVATRPSRRRRAAGSPSTSTAIGSASTSAPTTPCSARWMPSSSPRGVGENSPLVRSDPWPDWNGWASRSMRTATRRSAGHRRVISPTGAR